MADPPNRRAGFLRRWPRAGAIAAAAVFLTAGAAEPQNGCRTLFQPGTSLTLTGKTIPGAKNTISVAIALELTAGTGSEGGVPIVAGTVRSDRLKGGAVSWRSLSASRWGNLCMDTVAPNGRRWSFLALTWEDDNAHPNLHGVFDWSDGKDAGFVGFIDPKDGAYHEAQLTLQQGDRVGAPDVGRRSEPNAPPAPKTLCNALFGKHRSHFFVGRGYATEPGTSPGHMALHLSPGIGNGKAIPLAGGYIATGGPHDLERQSVAAETSACMDLSDPRYAMLQLESDRGGTIVLWLWGSDGVPQKDDRLVGYVTFPGSAVLRSKVAFWRL